MKKIKRGQILCIAVIAIMFIFALSYSNIYVANTVSGDVVEKSYAINENLKETVNGWKFENDNWYYYIDGRMVTGWLQDGGIWYYMHENGAMATGWVNDGGTWYYMNPSGAMATGWVNDGGTWYYMNPSGAMAIGWINDGGTWYYMNPSGAMAIGWINDGGTWYYMIGSGAMATGWVNDGGTWYYMHRSGAMATGWILDGGDWYYMHGNGAMATGWIEYCGNWYYLYESGEMAHNTWIDDFYVNEDGIWVQLNINYEELNLYWGYEVWQKNSGEFELRIENLSENEIVDWKSENPDIATVDQNGNVSFQNYGTTTIFATVHGKTYTCIIKIMQLKVYFAMEYTDSRLSEDEKIQWIEDGDFNISVGDTVRYKIVEVEYDAEGNVCEETDVTSKMNIVPEVEGYFIVNTEKGTIKALKIGSNQEDRSTNISVDVTSYKSNGAEWKQNLMLKVFTDDKELYRDRIFGGIKELDNKTIPIDCFTCFRVWCWIDGTYFTHDDVAIHYPNYYFFNTLEGDYTWESSDESVIEIIGCYGSSQNYFAEADVRFVGTGTTTITFKYKGEVIETATVTVIDK